MYAAGFNWMKQSYVSDPAPALFTQPPMPIKCPGAPQKIAYLAADHWRRQGVLDQIDVHLVLPTPGMFGVPEFAAILSEVVKRYGKVEAVKGIDLAVASGEFVAAHETYGRNRPEPAGA